jgi:hypothetical protein
MELREGGMFRLAFPRERLEEKMKQARKERKPGYRIAQLVDLESKGKKSVRRLGVLEVETRPDERRELERWRHKPQAERCVLWKAATVEERRRTMPPQNATPGRK